MPDNKKQEHIAHWIDLAQYDLDTAETLLKNERFLYVGFMCHQVIEKLLKALYVKIKTGVPPFSHNIRYLASESEIYLLFSENQKKLLDVLGPLNIETRYPDYKRKIFETLTAEKCADLLDQTKELFKWLQK